MSVGTRRALLLALALVVYATVLVAFVLFIASAVPLVFKDCR